MKLKRTLALSLAGATLMGSLAACSAGAAPAEQPAQEPAAQTLSTTTAAPASPKYVFLFIGDGMSYPQIQSTSDYLGALNDEDYWQAQPSLDDNQGAILDGPEYLNFMNFEGVGTAVTYDSNSFAPDSASTATSISTGHKTYSGSINVDETGTVEYETIAEQLKAQKGYEIGVSLLETAEQSGIMDKVIKAAGIIGMMVVGSMTCGMFWATLAVEFGSGDEVTTLQSVLDGIMPGMLGLAFMGLYYFLLKKKVSPMILILGTMVLGVVGVYFGILA